jgi:cytidine deaminase
MKKVELKTEAYWYAGPEALEATDRTLLELARSSRENSYSPYSQFKVGAAVLLENGEMLGGANYENASYPMCICAEQAVLAAASTQFPGIGIVAIAVTIQNPHQAIDQPVAPCGACRQIICETEIKNKQSMRVIIQGETGPIWIFHKGTDLLPLSFNGSFLFDGQR